MKKAGEKYYCPMHPEIVSDKPGKCPKCGGMELVPVGQPHHHDHKKMMSTPGVARDFLRRFFIVSALLVPLVVFGEVLPNKYLQFGVATAIFYFGFIFFEHARHEISAKKYGMMTLVSLAVGAGYLFSAAGTFIPAIKTEFYLEISTLIWVLLFGHFLEAKSSSAAGDALQEVAKLLPKSAHLILDGEVSNVDLSELKEGDYVRILPGEKAPADGIILKGSSNFNEAHITGESRPLKKIKGDRVVAGAVCIDGSVEIKLNRVGENSTIGQIQKLISQALETKPSAQRLADKASGWLTFTALGVSILTLAVWSLIVGETFVFAMTLAITVLVIACPHALGLAIPTVATIATRLAVKNGIFLKDMGKIEVVKRATTVVFDKTGTLTKGDFAVTSYTSDQVLLTTASLEQYSSHVIGMSISAYAKNKGMKLKEAADFRNIAGKGIEGKIGGKKYFVGRWGDAAVALVSDKKIIGEIVLEDEIKKESKKAVGDLHALGVKVAMLTGDKQRLAEDVAKKLKIDTFFAEVLPENKYEYIKKLQEGGEVVLMVGDGVNDAPALTQANAGVAVGAGTDVAVEAGDVVLTRSNPADIVALIILARKVYSKMVQNLVWALGYNILAIPAAAGVFIPLGFRLTPAVGAVLMSLSSVIVVVNAVTLKSAKLKI